ncbi:MAG: FHA domain-containing protein [Gemmatimonadales bacterium]|nr:MAG: FHA domain-containing protein [Gemmatimonadales bacterium]
MLKVPADEAPRHSGSGTNGSEIVEYQRPPDGTLQLLPGRLEVERGPGVGQEIRFVRVPGSPAEITFGRSEGPEFRHVQLHSPTVSRQHARLRFDGTGWSVRNESSTNPTTVNGHTLSSEIEEVPLSDGDLIEIGEITFRFRHEGSADRLPFRSSWHTDQGRRPTNQDAVVVRTLPGGRELAAVCDGMGSHHAGGVASHRALEGLVKALSEGVELEEAVQRSNASVLAAAEEEEDRDGMGTTLVALLRDGDHYDIANVGDSRAYRIGSDGIQQLTRDHSFMAEAVQDGRMSMEEAARSPWRNAVTRNLGAGRELEVDLFRGFDATQDHVVLLCTDGVHGVLSEDQIEEVFRNSADIRDLARALSEEALMKGGEDNVAVAAMTFGASPGVRPAQSGAPGDRPSSNDRG